MFLIRPLGLKPLLLLAFFLISSIGPPAWAGQDFARGVSYAKTGDYAGALKIFQRLYQSGERSPQLFYNLASCHYRLGEFSEAHEFFANLLNNDQYRALAAYNMGLIEAKLGDDVSAVNSFQRSINNLEAGEDRLLALNQKALRIISKRNASYLNNMSRRWRASIDMGVGYDNNALLLDQQAEIRAQVDQTSDFLLSNNIQLERWLSGTRRRGNMFSLSYNTQRYQKVDADTSRTTFSLSHYRKLSKTSKSIINVGASQSTYSEYRDRIYNAKYTYSSHYADQRRMSLSYRFQWVEPELKSEYWRGSSQQIKARLSMGELGKNVSFSAHYDVNNRNDKLDDPAQSYSPVRYGYQLAYYYKKLRRAYWFSYAYRVSRYRGDTVDTRVVDQVVEQVPILRVDRKKTVNFSYRYSFSRKLSWSLSVNREINASNFSLSNYQQNIITTDIRYEF